MRQLESCPACGSRSFRRAYSGRATRRPDDPKCWQLSRCTECDHGFLNPQPQWDEQADYYNADYDPYDPSSGLTDDFDATVETPGPRAVTGTSRYARACESSMSDAAEARSSAWLRPSGPRAEG